MSHNESRTNQSARNAAFSLISKIISTIPAIISRTVFLHFLNAEYLGLSGLFSNIITLLSFAELGIANTMLYHMYKPVKEKDENMQLALLRMYKNAYAIICSVVVIIGLAIVPFLYMIIPNASNIS